MASNTRVGAAKTSCQMLRCILHLCDSNFVRRVFILSSALKACPLWMADTALHPYSAILETFQKFITVRTRIPQVDFDGKAFE